MQMSTLTSLCIFVWNFLWSRKVKPQHWAAETNSWKQMSLWPSPWVPINSLITAEFLGADNITLPRSNGFDCWDKAIWLRSAALFKNKHFTISHTATKTLMHYCQNQWQPILSVYIQDLSQEAGDHPHPCSSACFRVTFAAISPSQICQHVIIPQVQSASLWDEKPFHLAVI